MHIRVKTVRSAVRSRWYSLALVFVVTMGSATPLQAQDAPRIQPIPGTLRGIVTDTLGNPISDVEVVLTQLRIQIRTGADGLFQFDSVKAGTYNVSARRLDYVVKGYQVKVPNSGGVVEVRMIPIGYTIAPITTSAQIGGVSGVIADTALRALNGVKVTVLGVRKSVQTDTAGKFFIPLDAGQYMLRIERDGYFRQMKSVMIPENEGRNIAVWLSPRTGPANHVEANELFDLNQRVIRGSSASTRFYTREGLERLGIRDLSGLARNWATGGISADCNVGIAGVSSLTIPISLLRVSELEFVEVYLPTIVPGGNSSRRTTTSISGSPTKFRTPTEIGRSTPKGECGQVTLRVWLRQ